MEVLEQGEYKFTDSVWWKVTLGNISSEQLISDAKASIIDRTTKTEQVRNAQKDEWASSWNLFKKIGSLFLDDYTSVERKINGSYDTSKIIQRINEYSNSLTISSKKMEKNFKDNLNIKKEQVKKLIERLLGEVNSFLKDIGNQEIRIQSLSGSITKLDDAIRENNETYVWLKNLKMKIEEE